MATGKYLSKQKAAAYLDVCTKTIDRLRDRGELKSIRVGTRHATMEVLYRLS